MRNIFIYYFSQKRHFMIRLIFLLIPILLIIAGCGSGGSSSSSISATTVVISWTAPTLNIDGSPLTDLAGYKIYYGPATNDYSEGSINVGLTTSYDTQALSAGYYCFVVVAYDTSGNESTYSDELCVTL